MSAALLMLPQQGGRSMLTGHNVHDPGRQKRGLRAGWFPWCYDRAAFTRQRIRAAFPCLVSAMEFAVDASRKQVRRV